MDGNRLFCYPDLFNGHQVAGSACSFTVLCSFKGSTEHNGGHSWPKPVRRHVFHAAGVTRTWPRATCKSNEPCQHQHAVDITHIINTLLKGSSGAGGGRFCG